MEALIIQTGTPPGQDGIALWVTMKNSMDIQYTYDCKLKKNPRNVIDDFGT
jgi:hypothetical protein